MRRYCISLVAVTLAMVLLSFLAMWFKPEWYLPVMPFLALYFGVIAGVQHLLVTKAMYRSPKAFVQIFMGTTVGVLLLHLIVMATWLLTHPAQAKLFTVAFLVGFVVSWVFETIAVLQFIRREKRRRQQ